MHTRIHKPDRSRSCRTTGPTLVNGQEIFYREAGDPSLPTLLLQVFPTGSHMFRDLISLQADDIHLEAPKHLRFGYGAIPSTAELTYGFLALTEAFTDAPGLSRFASQRIGAALVALWHCTAAGRGSKVLGSPGQTCHQAIMACTSESANWRARCMQFAPSAVAGRV